MRTDEVKTISTCQSDGMGKEQAVGQAKEPHSPEKVTVSAYLAQHYALPDELPPLPLPDEPFVKMWREADGADALAFLADAFGLSSLDFPWQAMDAIHIRFAVTLAGRLPVVTTASHADFSFMEALVNGRDKASAYPPTVNAFTIEARAKAIYRHRVILLNRAPYSNVPAEVVGLADDDWLRRSQALRTRHECVHYETLRIFGKMKNHALDEIAADAMGQIAAFGNFDADRQRLFFGLKCGEGTCTGRLSFYCQNVKEEERPQVYRAVDEVLDAVAADIREQTAKGVPEIEILQSLLGQSITRKGETL
ncbi:MAG: hypothetical protein J5963_03340 [Schwartzia sp.]|nr:hypothetical protein [Schwartzia sp. (in: firmicutes)]